MNTKTIDIQAKEWFDKINGNSYFAGIVTVNYNKPDEFSFNLHFQYGYGEHYKDVAAKKLDQLGYLPNFSEENVLWRYCRKHNIDLRASIQTGCKKAELKQYSN